MPIMRQFRAMIGGEDTRAPLARPKDDEGIIS